LAMETSGRIWRFFIVEEDRSRFIDREES